MQKTRADRKEALKSAFLVIITMMVLDAGPPHQSRLRAQEVRGSKPIPYTVTLRETVYKSNGTFSVAMDETIAVRTDGSYVQIIKHKKQVDGNLVDSDSARTIYFASGIKVDVNDIADAKSTTALKENLATFQRDPGSKCLNTLAGTPGSLSQETILGEEVIDGYRTVKITAQDRFAS